MTFAPSVLPGLLLLAAQLLVLATFGYVVARVALHQRHVLLALAQGLVIGPALWGLLANFILKLFPGQAGSLASWSLTLVLTAALARRSAHSLHVPARTLAGFSLATLGLFWAALACRQLLSIPDEDIHLAISSTIRVGQFPPVLSWIPDQPLPYHYGVDLLIALLTPPAGPDLAFTTEILGAYIWTGFAMVIAAVLLRHGGKGALVLAPLALTAGAWSLIWYTQPPDIARVLIPAGIPTAGIRATLTEVYWPSVSLPWEWPGEASPPNVWKPPFVHTYALALVVLERAADAASRRRWSTWPLALLVGFMGLMAEEVALVVLGLWVALEIIALRRTHRVRAGTRRASFGASAGPVLAAILLAAGGGVVTSLLTGVEGKDLSLGWHADAWSRRPLGTFATFPGSVGLVGLGVIPVALAAVLLARRNYLVLALAAASAALFLAALVLRYEPAGEVTRLDGHARNLALLALLVGLGIRLRSLRTNWRLAVLAAVAVLAVWPTIALPARSMAAAVGRGVHLTNAQPGEREFAEWVMGRAAIKPLRSERIATYIRTQTSIDDRIFSPQPHAMTVSTGRPNASGFPTLIHLFAVTGAEYEDALGFLEPTAIQRLGFTYLHASEEWVEGLPDRAKAWLRDPDLFELLLRDERDALYRILPTFLRLNPLPDRQSYEALRRLVPDGSTVNVPTPTSPLTAIRVASVLPHTRILGTLDPHIHYSLTNIPTEPLAGQLPDIVVVERDVSFDIGTVDFIPIWWNDAAVAYATRAELAVGVDAPPQSRHQVTVRLSNVRQEDSQITFTTHVTNHAPNQWTGQDWLLVRIEATSWKLPSQYESDGYTLVGTRWFGGQISPDVVDSSNTYRFDASKSQLEVQNPIHGFVVPPTSGGELKPGSYVLVARLTREYLQAAIIPVLEIVVTDSGHASLTAYEGERHVSVKACPERLRIAALGATLCRHLELQASPLASLQP
ncbi:MAG: hypothetical protein OXP73_10410 [Chloroflexota bacterium]|nr:hypothetical protein [Chloroflexota bacterium]